MQHHERDNRAESSRENPVVPKVTIQDELATLLAIERRGTMVASRGVRSLEYPLMFGFATDLRELQGKRCLDIGSGYSSFAAEAAECGVDVQAVDPLYPARISSDNSKARSTQDYSQAIYQLAQQELSDVLSKHGDSPRYVDSAWLVEEPLETINTPKKLVSEREAILKRFIADFTTTPERYIGASLPELIGVRGMNDFILMGHILGAYNQQPWCDYDFHLRSILRAAELLAPSGEIRIYPVASGADNLLGFPFDVPMSPESSKGAIEAERELRTHRCLSVDLREHGLSMELHPSKHKFVKGWTHMAVVRRVV